ncbi:hypothetical protein MMC34_005371 [Xylographa carneopallida]|nr:hypothetical protein [Xylographa carneopallida]
MTDQLIAQARNILEGQIDFQGQKKAELFTSFSLAGFGLVALLVGYIQQDIYVTLWLGLLGTFITFVVVVPPWPFYNKDPEPWLPDPNALTRMAIQVDGKKIN